ncbi:MAG: hypothetical protein AAF478_13240 [Pseudomonadota bacterium]
MTAADDIIREHDVFGDHRSSDLALARRIASISSEKWGSGDQHEYEAVVEGNIWNDHHAVQSALLAIHVLKRCDGFEMRELEKDLQENPKYKGERFTVNQIPVE